MVKFDFKGKSVYIDGYLKTNLEFLKQAVHKDWDNCLMCDGIEGAGKSILMQQVAAFLDSTFCLDRIVFSPAAFQKAIKDADKFQAVLYDEAYFGLSSRNYFSDVNKALVSMLTMIRAKNLHVLIVSPNFFEIERYVTLWRSKGLIHVYVGKNWERGYFGFYNYDRKKDLYIRGKKMFSYTVPPNFRGRFTNTYVVNKEDYAQKKLKAMVTRQNTVPQDRYQEQRDLLIRAMVKDGYKEVEVAKILKGLTGAAISLVVRNGQRLAESPL